MKAERDLGIGSWMGEIWIPSIHSRLTIISIVSNPYYECLDMQITRVIVSGYYVDNETKEKKTLGLYHKKHSWQ